MMTSGAKLLEYSGDPLVVLVGFAATEDTVVLPSTPVPGLLMFMVLPGTMGVVPPYVVSGFSTESARRYWLFRKPFVRRICAWRA